MIFVFDESLEGSDVKAKGILAKFIAAIVEKMPVSYTHLTLPTN